MCHILEFWPFQLHLKLLLGSIPGSDFYCCHSQLRHDSLIDTILIKRFLAYSKIRLGVTQHNFHCFTFENVLEFKIPTSIQSLSSYTVIQKWPWSSTISKVYWNNFSLNIKDLTDVFLFFFFNIFFLPWDQQKPCELGRDGIKSTGPPEKISAT